MSSFGGTVKLTGESEYRKALSEISSNLKVLNSEMKSVTSQYDKNDKSVENLSSQNEVLNKKIEEQEKKVSILKDALAKSAQETGENSETTKKWQTELNNAQADLNKLNRQVETNADAMKEAEKTTQAEADAVEDFGNEAEKSGEKALSMGDIIKANLISDAIKAGLSALVDGFKAIGSAIGDCLTAGAAYADNMLTLSAQTGLSTDTLEKYNAVAELTDVSMDTLTSSMSRNLKAMSDARDGSKAYAEAYEKLGVSVTNADGTLRDAETVYWETIDALSGVSDETERDALAMEIFGKKAQDLNTIIEMGSAGLAEYSYIAEDMGIVLGGEGLAALGALDDEMQIFSSTTEASGNIIATAFAPAMENLLRGVNNVAGSFNVLLSAIASGDEDGIAGAMEYLSTCVEHLVVNMSANLPQVLSMASNLITSLVQVIAQNLPSIVTVVLSFIPQLVQIITTNLPTIVTTVLSFIPQLVEALATNLPQIVTTIIDLLPVVIETLVGMIPTLIEAVLNLLTEVINALAENLPTIITTIVNMIPTVINTILQALPQLIQAVISLVMGIVNALPTIIQSLIQALPSIIQNIISALLAALPMLIDCGIQLFMSIIEAIPVIIETLIQELPNIINTIIDGLLNAIPMLLDGAIKLLMSIIEAIPTIISVLIEDIPNIVTTIINALLSRLPDLIQGAIQLFMGIIEAIPQIIKELIKQLPQIIKTIVNSLKDGIGNIKEVGKNLVQGLWNGISNAADWVIEKIKGFGQKILNGIKSFFGIKSPSRLFKDEVGQNLALGVGEGFADTMEDVSKEMQDSLPTEFDADINTSMNVASGYTQMNTYDMMVSAFKQALTEVKVVMDDREMGGFVTDTVERVVFA